VGRTENSEDAIVDTFIAVVSNTVSAGITLHIGDAFPAEGTEDLLCDLYGIIARDTYHSDTA
jgi:hypothetical protein